MTATQSTGVFSSGFQFGGVCFDCDGYITDPAHWSRDTAELVAYIAGIDHLTEAHWRLIDRLRDYYPRLRQRSALLQRCWDMLAADQGVAQLFGNCRTLWRLAGLPNPKRDDGTGAQPGARPGVAVEM